MNDLSFYISLVRFGDNAYCPITKMLICVASTTQEYYICDAINHDSCMCIRVCLLVRLLNNQSM